MKAETRPTGLTEKQLEKQSQIHDACRWKDVGALRVLGSTEGGFLTDELRRQACACIIVRELVRALTVDRACSTWI